MKDALPRTSGRLLIAAATGLTLVLPAYALGSWQQANQQSHLVSTAGPAAAPAAGTDTTDPLATTGVADATGASDTVGLDGLHGIDGRGGRGTRRTVISTTAAPAAIGPYSQAILAGSTLYVSGTLPIDPATNLLNTTATIEQQTELALKNLDAILREAHMTRTNVVTVSVFLANLDDFARFNTTYAAYFGTQSAPARATVQAARIPKDAKVEIGLVAVK